LPVVKCKYQLYYCDMRINAELLDFRAFLTVLSCGSFHRAAKQLNISQPALSRRIKGLEQALGNMLIERSTRHVAPTPIGRELQPLLTRLLDEFEDSVLSIGALGGRYAGQVTIASVPTAAFYFLPRVIRAFNQRYPGIRFRILDLSANEGLEAVARGEVEFGINFTGATRPDLRFTPLLQDEFVLACRKDHQLASAKELRWRDLSGHPLIGVSQSSANRAVLDQALSRANVQLDWFYEVTHLSTSLGLVEAGLGISVLPKLATPQTEHPVISTVRLKDPLVSRTIGVVERHSARLTPAAERFRRLLIDEWSSG
jgi:DNA-binding transcriptional LysR family regulator